MMKPHSSPKSAQQIRDETDRLIGSHKESVRAWLEARNHELLVDIEEDTVNCLVSSNADTVIISEPK